MNTIVFATMNIHKIEEVKRLLKDTLTIKSLKEIGCNEDIPEPHPSLEENAIEKARYVQEHYKLPCFSEDTGLEISVLNGAPGVRSARYAGESKNSNANIDLVLKQLKGNINRQARFRTIIALLIEQEKYLFEGIVNGHIAKERQGDSAFGYDPIFIPEGYDKSFAELPIQVKNSISHRAKAINKLLLFLESRQT